MSSAGNEPHGNSPSRLAFNNPPLVYISAYMFEVFLYGINILVFCAVVFVLVNRCKGFARWPLLSSAALMFTLSTASIVMSLWILFGSVIPGQPLLDSMSKARLSFYLINNMIADALLIYRCYVVWSHSFPIIILPCMFLVASTACVLFYLTSAVQGDFRRGRYVYMWLTLAFNISMTTLIATRIWWMARRFGKVLGSTLARRYYSAMVIIIESGSIYSLYVLADQVLKIMWDQKFLLLDAGASQIVTIAPALIIVLVGLDRQARDVESAMEISRDISVPVFSTVQSHQV